MLDFVHSRSQKMLGLFFKVRNFKVGADKSEFIKVKLSNKCLDIMHTIFLGSCLLVRLITFQPILVFENVAAEIHQRSYIIAAYKVKVVPYRH